MSNNFWKKKSPKKTASYLRVGRKGKLMDY